MSDKYWRKKLIDIKKVWSLRYIFFQGIFLPSFQQVSNGFFRGSRNSVKAKSTSAAAASFRPTETLLEDPAVTEVAKELSKIRKNDLAALLDKTILPRIQVPIWPGGCLFNST